MWPSAEDLPVSAQSEAGGRRWELPGEGGGRGHSPAGGHASSQVQHTLSPYKNIDQLKFCRPKTIPKSALSYEDILIEAAVKRTVEEHKKLMSRKEDDIVSKQLSKDLLMKAVKQSLSEEWYKKNHLINYLIIENIFYLS